MEIAKLYTIRDTSIFYDPSVPCLLAVHVGFMTHLEFREFLDIALDLMKEKKKEHGKMAWMVNLRKSDAANSEDISWLISDWNVRYSQLGMKYVAFVVPEDEYTMGSMNAELYTEASGKENSEKVIIKMFKNEESGKVWLREVLNQQ